ncbi:hypothetical protein [Streptomyces sp. LMG1-1-1.1]|uniref:hypothetical protein n=1 Tax=Streptomyces sp. LMG1-1-1.1 TaxID=3135245 RepID=UPI003466BA4A
MASWATTGCRCGHPRFRHGEPRFSGACAACLCGGFELPPPEVGSADPVPAPPEPDRTPHPGCPLQDPDCLGFHDFFRD